MIIIAHECRKIERERKEEKGESVNRNKKRRHQLRGRNVKEYRNGRNVDMVMME